MANAVIRKRIAISDAQNEMKTLCDKGQDVNFSIWDAPN